MKESSKRILSLVFAVLFLLISLYVFGSYVKPAFTAISEIRGEYQAAQKHLESQQRAKETFENLYGAFQDAASIQNLLAIALPNREAVPDTVHQIQDLATRNTILLANVSIEDAGVVAESLPDSLIKEIGKVKIELRAIGTYQNFKGFLQGIEDNIKLMDVIEVEADASQDVSVGNIVYNLTVETYYQK